MAGALGARAARASAMSLRASSLRTYATVTSIPPRPHHRVVVVGGGTAGVTVAAQLMRSKQFQKDDIAILDPAKDHHYQPGWTLVGSGLKPLGDMSRPLPSLIPSGVTHYPLKVSTFDPDNNALKTTDGNELSYDYLVVAPGLETNFAGVKGLPEALRDPGSKVSSIYSDATVEQVWRNIQGFKSGTAIFTQPAGVIKCAGAPQKIMWMALSQWERDGVRKDILPYFATGGPAMFAVPKYSKALEELRVKRRVEGLFQHNLVSVDAAKKVATFKNLAADGKEVEKEFGFLHVVPPQKPWDWVAKSPLADSAGWVDVDKTTTKHNKYANVFSIGDASSLPNSKTAAAISSQAPVLVDNLLSAMRGDELKAGYTGYASCPLLTGHNELMLCEFKYGGVPDETFAKVPGIGSQDVPRRVFYHIKKDFFPSVYWSSFVKGTWYGPRAWFRPDTAKTG
ncbi:Sulfide:quinone oxidoreductase/flavo-binding protein [Diaporthe helianthi]|uniref:Sulfide:quinone oxidoreductase, mitochondrial n=1 Tax=Diaporthe helianthi TaxID=158607 RepID=A0A2P5HZB4_DIAHE|nr:Sulfide:quinone oxidoreductase/flavo-binding protein [Diaporthe helianthi]